MPGDTVATCDFIQADGTYSIIVRSLSIREPATNLIRFDSNPQSIKKLIIQGQEVHYFPRGLPKLLPNLEQLSINHCGLKEINAEDLEGLNRLKFLDVSNNQLEYLPDNLFEHVPQLSHANFRNNKIKLKLLDPLTHHERVDLQHNDVINVVL